MLKRELKVNFKSFLIWTSVLLLLFLVVYLIYPSIITSENIQMIDEMMKLFPEEMLKVFNMDIASIDTAYGWLKTEGFIFVLLIIGLYASIMGSSIVLKEENDKTVEYLSFIPMKRSSVLTQKIICAIFYIFLMVIIVGIFNLVCLTLSGTFDVKQYVLLSVTPLLSALPLFAINLFISTFFHKTKHTFGISLGVTFVSYFLQIVSELNETTDFIKYFTVYALADIRNTLINTSINYVMILLSLFISSLFILLSYKQYNKKELI